MTKSPKFVVDNPFGGGRYDLGDLVGSEAADTDDTSTEDYWPRIPPSYGPPPVHLEDAVKEVCYIILLLQKTTAPDNGSGDVRCVSDLLLSLETRDDITELVLEYTSYDFALRNLAKMVKGTPEIDTLNIGSRATALKQHWENTRRDRSNGPEDIVYPPLLSSAPDKPKDWKLELTEKGREEAERYYNAIKTQRTYAYRYWQTKPPTPMGWAPKTGDSWAKTARAKVEAGDLFHSREWTPLWGGFDLASMDLMLDMGETRLTQAEMDEYFAASNTMSGMQADFQGRDLSKADVLRS